MIFEGNKINGMTFSAAKKTKVSVTHRSSANIIQWKNLEQDKLTGISIPTPKLLVRFNLANVTTQREILLPTNAKGVMKMTLFEVIDGNIFYNIILGRSRLHEIKAVSSTYYQLIKLPTPEGIKQIRGDQPVAREVNAISVSSSKGKEHAASQFQEPASAYELREVNQGEEESESYQVPRYF
ncbi:uncharacterized protein LOC142165879 [Nicotiana tabacum]|uniref:Uncharacterized protein LOC142165879 n=1 Tax=Nicotiana tabacum TaxID=4097 RepID=A0AC58S5Z6_TOBAC